MTTSQSVPEEVVTPLPPPPDECDDCDQSVHSERSFTIDEMVADQKPGSSRHTTDELFCSGSTNIRDASQRSVSFDEIAMQTTVRNFKYDLTPDEHKDVWYSVDEIYEFNFDYAMERRQKRHKEERMKDIAASMLTTPEIELI